MRLKVSNDEGHSDDQQVAVADRANESSDSAKGSRLIDRSLGLLKARTAVIQRFSLWLGSAWLLGFPAVGRAGGSLVGDSGDAMFNFAVLRWGTRSMGSGFADFWTGPMFHTAHLPMAFSDTHLGLLPIFAPLSWVVGPVAAVNVIYAGLFVVALEATWRLCHRVTAYGAGSIVGALVFTYSSIRLGQAGHFQLMLGALLPVIALMVLRLTDDEPKWWQAAVLGLSFSMLTLSASYLGLAAALLVCGLVLARLLRILRNPRRLLPRLVLAAGIIAILVGPAAVRYLELQNDPYFTRDPSTALGTTLDGLTEVQGSTVIMDSLANQREPYSENRSFPGVVGLAAGCVGLVISLRKGWWEQSGLDPKRRAEALSLGGVGLVVGVASFGNNLIYKVLALVVPGFSGIRVPARLIVVSQLSVALFAAIGVTAIAGYAFRTRRIAAGACFLMSAVVIAESALHLPLTLSPLNQANFMSVNLALRSLPEGVVLELPARPPSAGALWPYTEAPRMVAAGEDHHARVNGYSGFFPKWYEADMSAANDPSSVAGQAVLARRGVKYLVFRTAAFVSGNTGSDALALPEGSSWMSTESAAREIGELPSNLVAQVDQVVGGFVVTLR